MVSVADQLARGVYESGRYILCDDIAETDDLRAFIETEAFRDFESGTQLSTRNRKHKVFSFEAEFIQGPLVMKVRWNNPDYSMGRRLNLLWNATFRDSCERSFCGALALKQAGVPAIDPLAFWTAGGPRGRQSYFLYRRIDASCSMKDLKTALQADDSEDRKKEFSAGLSAMAQVLSKMHVNGIRHGDLACGNILLHKHKDDFTAALIDTDNVLRVRGHGRIKEFFDLRDFKRIDFDTETLERFYRIYCEAAGRSVRLRDLQFWRSGWSRPVRSLRKWLQRGFRKRVQD